MLYHISNNRGSFTEKKIKRGLILTKLSFDFNPNESLMESFPIVTLIITFSFIKFKERMRYRRVCKHFNVALKDNWNYEFGVKHKGVYNVSDTYTNIRLFALTNVKYEKQCSFFMYIIHNGFHSNLIIPYILKSGYKDVLMEVTKEGLFPFLQRNDAHTALHLLCKYGTNRGDMGLFIEFFKYQDLMMKENLHVYPHTFFKRILMTRNLELLAILYDDGKTKIVKDENFELYKIEMMLPLDPQQIDELTRGKWFSSDTIKCVIEMCDFSYHKRYVF